MKLSRRALLTTLSASALAAQQAETGFKSLFDGSTLNGWKLIRGRGRGYVVENGVIVCPEDGGGNLFTDREYSDFVLRLDWRLWEGGNNGIGIRAPLEGDAAYVGMEIQVLDDESPKYKGRLKPTQYTGSIYDVFPARTGFVKRDGAWNSYEITAYGPRIHIVLNGETTLDADLSRVADEAVLRRHPGLRRRSGHIGFLGHGTRVEFRNIRVREM
ncbi:MAG: DUF1080 domain-containing protein [Bryobacteraceae bacterium]|nr:DUF1080 domain-containing protein [Solibacteraceae bacterium]MCO5353625.1 DUF1080 domain-containing protein [Bryobacteraceae bacterium]